MDQEESPSPRDPSSSSPEESAENPSDAEESADTEEQADTGPTDLLGDQPWLRPEGSDPGTDSAADEEDTSGAPAQQPWLRPGRDESDATTPPHPTPQRLLTGLQGLLEPVDLDEPLSPTASPTLPQIDLSDAHRRRLRSVLSSEVPLADMPPALGPAGEGLVRRSWIYWLLALLLGLGVLGSSEPPLAEPHIWPGVLEAYQVIAALPRTPIVLVDWAYDPATAGELDLVARPVIEHLLERQAQLLVVSQLAGGPATARRLIAQSAGALQRSGQPQDLDLLLTEGGYLPGGASTLPLLGQSPAVGLPVDLSGRRAQTLAPLRSLEQRAPDLSLVVAARSDDVARWLEQVQPLNRAPVIAVTSAVADPPLRPYWDSGQLAGLVSGFDGGFSYRKLLTRPLSRSVSQRSWRQISGQNWGFIAVMAVVILGNLAALAERNEP